MQTKLHEEQLRLLSHMARYPLMDYQDCLDMLDTGGTGDRTALSYAFRPLTKNDYLIKRKDGSVTITAKGRRLAPGIEPLISVGGGEAERHRIMEVSRMAALLERNGIPSAADVPEDGSGPCFIPSARWRKIAPGILSTTRFVGVIVNGDHRLAVYDIGDGKIEWQTRAEGSLFYTKYGSYETRATGMLLICQEDKRDEIAENIVRHTMWYRRQLLLSHCAERNKPTRWSRSPIVLRAQYKHVYLTSPKRIKKALNDIRVEKEYIDALLRHGDRLREPKQGDVEFWPRRLYVNPATDLLKFVYFFSEAKDDMAMLKKGYQNPIRYEVILKPEDDAILALYPDVANMEEVTFYHIKSG